MNVQEKIQGTGVAIITPFTKSGGVDYSSLSNLVEDIIVNKVDFIVALGTTSEAATLNSSEKDKVVKTIIDSSEGRVPIILGIGGNNTAQLIETIQTTDFKDISGILSVAPYYNKPSQNGMYEHFSAIAKVCPVPIILYNVPSRTSSNLTAKTVLKLASEHWNIVAVKEASGDFGQVMDILKNKPDEFAVLSGDDALTFPLMSLGGDGVISVVANAYPAAFSSMVRLLLNNKYEKARAVHYSLLDIIEQLFADGNPGGVKAALSIQGMCGNYLRLPLVRINKKTQAKLRKLIEDYEPAL